LLDSWRLFILPPADAVIIHAFETYTLYGILHWVLRRRTILISHYDGSPLNNEAVPRGLRGFLRRKVIERTSGFVPFSNSAARITQELYPSTDSRTVVLHPGIDLLKWPLRPYRSPGERFRLLFVGGDISRKGGDTLSDAFEQSLSEYCELSIATQSAYLTEQMRTRIQSLPNTKLYLDLTPDSPALQQLYRESDAFVLPTNADVSSWAALEAMATGIPVVISNLRGIPDIVINEITGLLIPPGDASALVAAVRRLRDSKDLRARLVRQGRAHVEANFDVRINTGRLLTLAKSLIDTQVA
jgi:glycosyltransferase involved in cell wall biosynthesis